MQLALISSLQDASEEAQERTVYLAASAILLQII